MTDQKDIFQKTSSESDSWELLVSMLNAITESAFLMGLDGTILAANAAMASRLGFEKEEDLTGRSAYEVIPRDVMEPRREKALIVAKTGNPMQFEDVRYGRVISNSIYPVFNKEGRVAGLAIFGTDITESKLRQEKLSLMAEMVDRAPVSITIHDTEGRFLYANRETFDMHGYRKDEFLNINLHDLDVPESEALLEKRFRFIAEEGEMSFESSHFRKDGTSFPLHVRAKMVEWKGNPAVLSIASDITKRKQAEDRLRTTKDRLQAIIDHSPTLISEFDTQGRYLLVNSQIEGIFGRPVAEIEGKTFDELLDTETVQRFMERIKKILETLEPLAVEDTLLLDGERREYLTTLFPLMDKDGVMYSIGSVAHDITEQKQARDSLNEALIKLRRVTGSVIQVIVSAVESRDPYTAGHQKRVGDLARSIAGEMGLSTDMTEGIRVAGVIHDLGKIGIPAEILSKPHRLNKMEFAIIKEHPKIGYEILKDVAFDWPVAEMVSQHHERLDGSGYPEGLKGEDILIEARILAVADVVEAMSSHRPYRPTVGLDRALEDIESGRGTLYDPDVADACMRLFKEKQYRFVDI